MTDEADKETLNKIKHYVQQRTNDIVKRTPNSFILPWLGSMEIVHARKTSEKSAALTVRYPVLSEYLNPAGTLQGGACATFFDLCTGWTLNPLAKKDFWPTNGVSRSLNVVYLRPAMEGEMLVLECETVSVGKMAALIRGVLKREKDGAVIATVEHDKIDPSTKARM